MLSRFGHWGFVLCHTQIMQTEICEEERGLVNGTEGSLQKLASMMVCLLNDQR